MPPSNGGPKARRAWALARAPAGERHYGRAQDSTQQYAISINLQLKQPTQCNRHRMSDAACPSGQAVGKIWVRHCPCSASFVTAPLSVTAFGGGIVRGYHLDARALVPILALDFQPCPPRSHVTCGRGTPT